MNGWCPLDVPTEKLEKLNCEVKELRGGSSNDTSNILSMVVTSIKNAATHGIRLQHGTPNRADGDCIFESILDNISLRSCFEEVLNGPSEYYRKNGWKKQKK